PPPAGVAAAVCLEGSSSPNKRSMGLAPSMVARPVDDLRRQQLIEALEAHALRAWPATISQPTSDGWTLRATPGLDRGRNNHALTLCRALAPVELDPALDRAAAFAAHHGIRLGIQVS